MTISQERRERKQANGPPADEWSSLVSVYAELLGPEPTVVRFPDGNRREAGTWHDLYSQVASWLVMQGKLNKPVPMPIGSSRYLVNEMPFHNHERFERSYELPNGMWLEAQGNSQLVLDRAIMLLEMFDVDPASVDVYLEERGEDGWIR